MKNVNARILKSKYALLSELGSKFNLSFSSHLEINNKIIALDGLKRMLLVLDVKNELIQPYIIDLGKVTTVSIKRTYGSIRSGELRFKKFEEFLRKIDLQFEYSDKNESGVLSFYDSELDRLRDLPGLERNAKNWQMILSKLVVSRDARIKKDSNKLLLA